MKSLVSVIIPTKNSEKTIEACLKSIKNQSYKFIELIVVDNNSTDNTVEIAKKYTKKVFNKGPERSAQRNLGALKSKGKFLLFIDSDMELENNVVEECVDKFRIQDLKLTIGGVIIPEKSFGTSFWAKCKALERSFYLEVNWIEAARFFSYDAFMETNGYDENLISGEDWDLNQRIAKKYKIVRINNFIIHNEGDLSLMQNLKKKYYYSKNIEKYKNKNKTDFKSQSSFVNRYALFFSKPKKLLKNPIIGFGMLFMKTSEFGVGAIGYLKK